MTHLHVVVRLYGSVVEDRLVPLRGAVRLGESERAAVSFPGADILVEAQGGRFLVRGRPLLDGAPVEVTLGTVRLTLTQIRSTTRRLDAIPDVRLLLATAAVALFASWCDATSGFVARNPGATAGLMEVVERLAPGLEIVDAKNATLVSDKAEAAVLTSDQESLVLRSEWPPQTSITRLASEDAPK